MGNKGGKTQAVAASEKQPEPESEKVASPREASQKAPPKDGAGGDSGGKHDDVGESSSSRAGHDRQRDRRRSPQAAEGKRGGHKEAEDDAGSSPSPRELRGDSGRDRGRGRGGGRGTDPEEVGGEGRGGGGGGGSHRRLPLDDGQGDAPLSSPASSASTAAASTDRSQRSHRAQHRSPSNHSPRGSGRQGGSHRDSAGSRARDADSSRRHHHKRQEQQQQQQQQKQQQSRAAQPRVQQQQRVPFKPQPAVPSPQPAKPAKPSKPATRGFAGTTSFQTPNNVGAGADTHTVSGFDNERFRRANANKGAAGTSTRTFRPTFAARQAAYNSNTFSLHAAQQPQQEQQIDPAPPRTPPQPVVPETDPHTPGMYVGLYRFVVAWRACLCCRWSWCSIMMC